MSLALLWSCGGSGSKEGADMAGKPAAEEPLTKAKPENKGKALVREMVAAMGGRDKFYAQNDVEYTYTYSVPAENKKDISLERYKFQGEKSWALYETHEKLVFPDKEGPVEMAFDGNDTWLTIDGELVTDSAAVALADFMRKTNYYWFCMMFKLLDPGVNYAYQGTKMIDSVTYETVKITFGENVGDAQDTYVLYVNPVTHLVDYFLFTVMDFGRSEPLLMKMQYQDINGLKITKFREYGPADWEGNLKDGMGVKVYYEDVKFNVGLTDELFEEPDLAQ